jgi:hypothetical protein
MCLLYCLAIDPTLFRSALMGTRKGRLTGIIVLPQLNSLASEPPPCEVCEREIVTGEAASCHLLLISHEPGAGIGANGAREPYEPRPAAKAGKRRLLPSFSPSLRLLNFKGTGKEARYQPVPQFSLATFCSECQSFPKQRVSRSDAHYPSIATPPCPPRAELDRSSNSNPPSARHR